MEKIKGNGFVYFVISFTFPVAFLFYLFEWLSESFERPFLSVLYLFILVMDVVIFSYSIIYVIQNSKGKIYLEVNDWGIGVKRNPWKMKKYPFSDFSGFTVGKKMNTRYLVAVEKSTSKNRILFYEFEFRSPIEKICTIIAEKTKLTPK